MSIGRPLAEMDREELSEWVEDRRRAREVTPGRKPRNQTVKGLAKAWNVPEQLIMEEILNGPKND